MKKTGPTNRRFIIAGVLGIAAILPLILFPSSRPMPAGTDIKGPSVPVRPGDIRLLVDDTAWDPASGQRIIRQEIFDELLAMIGRADSFICLDMFLWNPWKGSVPEGHRKLSTELAEALIRRKGEAPDLDILLLTDPINRIYGDTAPDFYDRLSQAEIPVIFTDLDRLPDSNLLFSPYWSLAERAFRIPPLAGWVRAPRLKNPFQKDGREISLLQFGRMLRFKANHRKVAVTGSSGHGLEMLVGSFNPADGSSAHSNMALHVRGAAALEALESEMEIIRWSIQSMGKDGAGNPDRIKSSLASMARKATALATQEGDQPQWPRVTLLTEGSIARTVTSLINSASTRDEIRLSMFYLSERGILEALKDAAWRGVSLRLILDANRDAFGMTKIGVPNRITAAQLMELSGSCDVQVRWADTHGEQYHLKAFSLINHRSGTGILLLGSANWTRRNLANLNLEAGLLVDNAPRIMEDFHRYFDTAWNNSDGKIHTVPYDHWREKGLKLLLKKGLYQIQERWGAGTF